MQDRDDGIGLLVRLDRGHRLVAVGIETLSGRRVQVGDARPVESVAQLALRQLDIAGFGNTGNRFIVELENGKPTVQLQKVLDVLDLLGLEVLVRPKTSRAL